MNWYKFEKTLKEKKMFLFSPLDVRRVFHVSKVAATFLLYRYAKQKFIIRFKRGLYIFREEDVNIPFLANKLYEPSYLSLEFALSFHGIIPETVYEITSVTTKPTRRFETLNRVFSYRRIKKEAFTGYVPLRQDGMVFLIADPEKAFVDSVYFQLRTKKTFDRFTIKGLDAQKALGYARLFDKKTVLAVKNYFL